MKQKEPLILTIPAPCQQPWNEMLPENDGRYCQSCQKKVTDFSGMTDRELTQAITKAGPACCGRFDAAQLERNILAAQQPSRPFLPVAALAMMVAVTPETVNAQQVHKTTLSTKAKVKIKQPLTGNIEGQIINGETGEGIERASIRLQGTYDGAVTDIDGCFNVSIPSDFNDTFAILRISHVNYEPLDVRYDSAGGLPHIISLRSKYEQVRELVVTADLTRISKEYIVGAYVTVKRPTIWQRMRHMFCKHRKPKTEDEE